MTVKAVSLPKAASDGDSVTYGGSELMKTEIKVIVE